MSVSGDAVMGSVIRAKPNPADRGTELLSRVEYRLMQSEEERDQVYRLRYRAYLQEGAIEPNSDERIEDKFDTLPNAWIFGLYVEGTLASSIRISVATPDSPLTPAVDAFPEYLEPELARGKVIVDPNRFVADPVRTKRIPELPYLTVRLGYVACGHFNADIGTATVRAEHQAFYRRVFLQDVLCAPRPYPSLTKPLSLMAAHYPTVRERIFRRYPYFRSTVEERCRLFGSVAQGTLPSHPAHLDGEHVTLQPRQSTI
jgi:N-acyl-L-homoserine lactone synthetase